MKNYDVQIMLVKYSRSILTNIKDNEEEIINAFVEYYGEKYRKLITRKIKNISYYSYLTYNDANYINDYLKKSLELKFSKYCNIDYSTLDISKLDSNTYLSLFLILHNISIIEIPKVIVNFRKYLKDNKILNDYYKLVKYFSMGREENFFEKSLPSNLVSAQDLNIEDINGLEFNYISKSKKEKSCIFYSLLANDKVIIHEINHAVTDNVIAIATEDGKYAQLEKNGMYISNPMLDPSDVYFEELINDKVARIITDRLHEKGISFFDDLPNLEDKEYISYPLINLFFEKYESLLKESRITESANYIYRKIDKDKFDKYKRVIYEIFMNSDNNIKKEDIEMVEELVLNIEKEEQEAKILLDSSCKVRILNKKKFLKEVNINNKK